MTSDISDIFTRFYLRVEDYKIAGLEEEIANELLNGYLRQTLSKPFIRRLFSSVSFDEDVGEVEYTMREAWDDDADRDFVEEALALGMVSQWLSTQYHTVRNTVQMFSNKEQTFFSQANQMTELREMYNKSNIDFRKFVRDRSYGIRLVNSE